MKTLHLTLKKKWFDMIASGEKKEEYREIKDFWIKRLLLCSGNDPVPFGYYCQKALCTSCIDRGNVFKPKPFTHVLFQHGYTKNAPQMLVELKDISVGNAIPEWSDNWQGNVFIIKLGEIISRS